MIEGLINKQSNLFSVEIRRNTKELDSSISSVVTTKVGLNSISANNLKSQVGYTSVDAEVWIAYGGCAKDLI